jgi:hypothetical protein
MEWKKLTEDSSLRMTSEIDKTNIHSPLNANNGNQTNPNRVKPKMLKQIVVSKNEKELIVDIRDFMKNIMEMSPENQKLALFPERF